MTPESILFPLTMTLRVSLLATAAALVLGVAMAALVERWRLPGRDALDSVLTLPLVLPPTVMGYYLLVVFGRRGVIGVWLKEVFGVSLIFTWQGAVLAATVVAFPLVYRSARAALEGVGRNLPDAARTLGASEAAVFLRVCLPLAARGIMAGTMLALARAMGEFGATLMVAGNLPGKTQTLSLAVYSAVQAGDDKTALILVGAISLVCVVVLTVAAKLVKPKY